MQKVTLYSLVLLFLAACSTGNKSQNSAVKQTQDSSAVKTKGPGKQTLPALEEKLITLHHGLVRSRENADSLSYYSEAFTTQMLAVIKENPASIAYDFTRLQDSSHCYITTSADGNLRLYSWDDELGGTMRFFKNIYQSRLGTTVITTMPQMEEGDNGGFYSKLYPLDTVQHHYLAIINSIGSTRDVYQGARIFTITPQGLSDTTRLFMTPEGMANELGIGFDFFSVVDRPERPLNLVRFDPIKKTLTVPIVNDKGEVTANNVVYHYNGRVFKKK